MTNIIFFCRISKAKPENGKAKIVENARIESENRNFFQSVIFKKFPNFCFWTVLHLWPMDDERVLLLLPSPPPPKTSLPQFVDEHLCVCVCGVCDNSLHTNSSTIFPFRFFHFCAFNALSSTTRDAAVAVA